MRFMVYVLLVAMVSLSIVVGFEFEAISNSRTEAQNRNLATWHQVICKIEVTVLSTPGMTDAKKQRAVDFYDGLLQNIGAAPCGIEAH